MVAMAAVTPGRRQRNKKRLVVCPDCGRQRTTAGQATRCRSCGVRWSWRYNNHKPRPQGSCLWRPSRIRLLTEVEAAWLGAMIEGEGSISYCSSRRYSIRVANSEVETIATCLRLAGDGTIHRHLAQPHQHYDSWIWNLSASNALLAFIPQILPFLTGKREVARRLLEMIK